MSQNDMDHVITTLDYKKGVKNLMDNAPNLKKLPSEYVLALEANPLAAAHAHIPIIDLTALDGDSEARISTVKAIASACQHWGIFTVSENSMLPFPTVHEFSNVNSKY